MLPSDPGTRHVPAPQREDWYSDDEHHRWPLRDILGHCAALRDGACTAVRA